MTRALVIGAGHNGLMAAIHLAAHGLEVTVLEHAPRPGGASTSEACTLPGFVHDHCAGFLPMTVASPAMRELELERDGLEWINPAVVLSHPFMDGSAIALHRDVAETAVSLGAAGAGWSAAMNRLLPLATPLVEAVLSPLPPLRTPARLALGLRGEGAGMGAPAGRLGRGSRPRPVRRRPPGDRLAGGIGATFRIAADGGGQRRLRAAAAAARSQSRLAAATRRGPVARRRPRATRASARARRIRCDASVEQVLVRGGRVAGVRLADGDELPADAVVSTVSAGVLARLIPAGAPAWPVAPATADLALRHRAVQARLRALRTRCRGPPPSRGDRRSSMSPAKLEEPDPRRRRCPSRRRARVPGAGRRPAIAARLQPGPRRDGTPSTSTATCPRATRSRTRRWPTGSRHSSSASPPASATSYWLGPSGAPWQTEQQNPSLVGGDLAGGSYELDQQLIFRPSPQLSRYRSPLRGLYVAGASTHPGGAVHGMSGRGAARALLRDRRLRRVSPAASG